MKILFYIGHPAQFHFIKNAVSILEKNGHDVLITYRTKDVLGELLSKTDFNYINIEKKRINHKGKFGLLRMGIHALFQFGKVFFKFKPDICLGLDPVAARYCKFLKIPYIFIAEDDYSIIKKLCDLLFPYSDAIVAPSVCDYSIAEDKKIGYYGYMKLAYLHPNRFTPDFSKIQKYIPCNKYVLIRLVSLTAHHDEGINGINSEVLSKIVSIIKFKGYGILISSETKLPYKFLNYQLKSPTEDIHHILAYASLVVCDSQSMAVESAMLGTPSIRFNDFAGKITVLEELEYKYNLTYGVHTSKPEMFFDYLHMLLATYDFYNTFKKRQKKMLDDKIDVTAFLVWFIENYPESKKIMIANPEYQNCFK